MINLLFYFNVLLSLFLFVLNYEYVRRQWKLKIVNPLLLLLVVYIPTVFAPIFLGPLVLIDDGFLNRYYQYAILVTNVYLLFTLFSTIFFFKFLLKIKGFEFFLLRIYSYKPSVNNLKLLEFFFLFFALSLFFLMAQSSFGLLNWVAAPRTGYQYHRDGVGSLFALSLTFLSVAYTLSFLGTTKISKFIFKSLLYIFVVYFWGSKGFIVSFGMFFLLCLYFARYKHLKLVVIFSFPIIFSLVLYNLYTALGSVGYVEVLSYFDHYRNSAMYYEAYLSGQLELFYGKVMLTDFWSLVPRAVYPEKPYVYGLYLINDFLFPGMTEIGQTPAFGGPVKEFADFGFFSVIFFAFFNIAYWTKIYLLNLYFKSSEKGILFNKNLLLIIIFCICFSPAFLAYIPASLGVVLIIIIWFSFGLVSRMRFR